MEVIKARCGEDVGLIPVFSLCASQVSAALQCFSAPATGRGTLSSGQTVTV